MKTYERPYGIPLLPIADESAGDRRQTERGNGLEKVLESGPVCPVSEFMENEPDPLPWRERIAAIVESEQRHERRRGAEAATGS